jgi:hypothetical protein
VPDHTNRLANETSPYLLQHAHNPVDWYPWGPEALERAKREDKPVLLSIGYAACHWCHVMERESFEEPATASLMNESFVCIKVDREERPDIDAIYMNAVQAMTGHGGWPMTMFLTPEGVPFFGGTYFPPEDRHGLPSFTRVLESVARLWTQRRSELVAQGAELMKRLAEMEPKSSAEPLSSSLFAAAVRRIAAAADAMHGGFGRAPKFPQAPVLELVLRADARGLSGLRGPIDLTLTRMALGGIYDQIGGGFHRYSVDDQWLVPHFEKMLYDNAQLARVYLHAWQATGNALYRRIAEETLDYLIRDMRSDRGGFHASEDADSEGHEGTFYTWTYDELARIAPEALDYYGASPEGNFEGRTIATAAGPEPPAESRARLLDARSRRIRPGLDDKVLASWNGLAIAALAEAGPALGRADFVEAARAAATFVLDEMRTQHGRLLHSWRAGSARVLGLLEDYAFMADGLLELWQATFEPAWLDACRGLASSAIDLFSGTGPGFHTTGSDHERLIVRSKEVVESATPAPGAVLSLVLQRLGVVYDDAALARAGVEALRVAVPYMQRAPQAVATWLQALAFYVSTPVEIALLGALESDGMRALRRILDARYMPHRVLAGAESARSDIALLRDREPLSGRPTAFVCRRYVCKLPVTDPEDLARQLDEVKG